MAVYDRTTDPSSAQYRSLLEIVDDVLARHEAPEIVPKRHFQIQCESTYLTTELTRQNALCILRVGHLHLCGRGLSRPGQISIEPPDEMERRLR